MNDENFDKIFGDKLNAGKDFAFTEAKWDKMESQLMAFQAARRRRRSIFWLSLPLLALLGFMAWGGWTLHKVQNDLASLTQEVKTLRLEKQIGRDSSVTTPNLPLQNNPNSTKNDTVYHHVVVKRYDTIFQTVVNRQISDAAFPQQTIFGETKKSKVETIVSENDLKLVINNAPLKIDNTANNIPKKVENTALQASSSVVNDKGLSEKNEPKLIEKAVFVDKADIKDSLKTVTSELPQPIVGKKSDTTTTRDPLSIKAEKPIEIVETALEKPIEKQNMKRPPIIKPIKIDGYELGISSGFAIIDGENIIRQEGFTAGVRGGILLGERWEVVGEAQFLGLSYEIDNITGKYDIPTISPPSPNDVFKEVLVKQPYIQYSLGLQYALLQKRLKPYIGASVLGQSKLEEHFDYQFKNQVTKEDVFVRTQRNEANFQIPILRLQLGAEYPIFKKISAQLESSYDVKLGSKPQFQPLYQVKGAVLYRF